MTPPLLRRLTRYLNRLLVIILVVTASSLRAQTVAQYTFGSATGTWSPISGGTVLNTVTSTFDDQTYTINPVANVLFAGTYYDLVYVSANGFVTFTAAPSGTEYIPIESTSTGYTGAISAFGCNVTNATSGTREIRWQEVGSEVIIQWLGARRTGQTESISFQIRINTSTGVVKTVYNASVPSASTLNYPQVGLRGASNAVYNNRAVDQTGPTTGWSWSVSRAGTTNGDECRYNNTNTGTISRSPVDGLTYTWTPPCLPPTTSAAGADQTLCISTTSMTMAANAPTVGSGAWSVVSVPSGGSTSTAQFGGGVANPTATFTPSPLLAGTYTLRWTISNGVCTASTDDIAIIVKALSVTANAAADQTVCAATATLAGNTASPGTGLWTLISGAGNISANTTANSGLTALGLGANTFQWTITNSPCPATSDQVTITRLDVPTTPNAGPDQTHCISTTSMTLAANTPTVGTGAWSVVTVPSGGSTSTAQFGGGVANPGATFTPSPLLAGTYTLRWTISNGICTPLTNDVAIIVSALSVTANAGPDQTVCAATATLAGNSASPGTGLWTLVSGAGSISANTTANSGLTALGLGANTFQWTITNSPCPATSDQVTITRLDVPTTPNAGPDQTHCISTTSMTLAANTPTVGTGAWSVVTVPSGGSTSTAQFGGGVANPGATFTPSPLLAGTYTLRWTISNGICTPLTNDVAIIVKALSVTSAAGPDQTVCSSSATLAGNGASPGAGLWTLVSGAGSISANTTANSGLTALGLGANTFQWTITNSPCPSTSDQVVITRDASPTTANAGTDQTMCALNTLTLAANAPSVGTASWTAIAGPNTSLAQLSSATANNAGFTPTTSGTYTLTWTTANGVCANSTDNVVVTVNPKPAVPTMTPTSASICAGGNTGLSASSPNVSTSLSGGAITITEGFFSTPATSPYPSALAVSGLPTSGVSVTSVTINGVTEPRPDDLDILLRSPLGTNVVLVSDAGGTSTAASGVNWTIQDGASAFSDGSANATGTYAPTNYETTDNFTSPGPGSVTQASPSLSLFSGNPNGTWNLYAIDDAANFFQSGSISSWSITFSVPMGYAWTPGSVSPLNTASVTATPSGTTTYTVTVTNPVTTCQNTNMVTVTVVPVPNAGSNNTLTICSNDAAANMGTLLGSHNAGSWTGPNTVTGDLYNPATMGPGNYVYTVTAAPCPNATATIAVTENTATPRYLDSDGDGFGDAGNSVLSCSPLPGRVSNSTDCDDTQNLYADGDGDGFGAGTPVACGVADNSDCNDAQYQYADGDGDGFGAGSPVACGVGNNSDCNDAELRYADTDGDGFGAGSPIACGGVTNNTDDCPTVIGLVGSNCDAQAGPGFVLGQLNNSCQCIQIACTETVVLELRTDANSDEAGWEILDQNTNLVICSGGAPADPFPNGITSPITPECCLPVGCYRLRVLDSGGDGFVSGGITGGYQLREQGMNGRRIIDNFGNFTSGHTSTCASAFDNGAFCVPVGNDRPIFSSCDKLDWVNNQFLVATENTNVSAQWDVTPPIVQPTNSGYEFWYFDPNGSYSYRRFRNHATSDGYGTGATRACHMKVNGWVNTVLAPHIPANILLNVRIRGRVNGNNEAFGPACLFKMDAARAACPIVKLQDNPLNIPDFSCGVVKVFGGANSSANRITANPPQFSPAAPAGQVRYQFRFRIPGENICIVRPANSSPTLHLNWGGSGQLECSKTYEVDVRVSKDGGATWCVADGDPTCGLNVTPWGKVCNVTISTSTFCPDDDDMTGGSSNLALTGNGELTMYPNPNHGEQVFINLRAVESEVNTISVDIYDLTGKRVIAKTVAVSGGMVNSNLDLNGDLNSGVYIVNITAGTKTYTQRLVIQK